uniref:NADH-ubiquinone oxidoreductase chain 4L n=1 Tax=Millepora sp. EK-2011 TaxID=1104536 RepID=G9ISP9_9CNID|nr:NADH dehydrogenase subunit 4L [Millepora sp. EK-2011]
MYSLTVFPYILFTISILGIIINRSNIILLLISIEVMLISISLNFLVLSSSTNDFTGLIVAVFVITVAAVESAIGLSIMISFYKVKGSVSIRFLNLLKG